MPLRPPLRQSGAALRHGALTILGNGDRRPGANRSQKLFRAQQPDRRRLLSSRPARKSSSDCASANWWLTFGGGRSQASW